jgi:hypothetical protein
MSVAVDGTEGQRFESSLARTKSPAIAGVSAAQAGATVAGPKGGASAGNGHRGSAGVVGRTPSGASSYLLAGLGLCAFCPLAAGLRSVRMHLAHVEPAHVALQRIGREHLMAPRTDLGLLPLTMKEPHAVGIPNKPA